MFFKTKNEKKIYYENIYIPQYHNVYNIMAVLIISKILNIKNKIIHSILNKIDVMEHRMEKLPYIINNVIFINDSKSTNIGSSIFALQQIHAPIVWIIGGKDKGNDYKEIIPLVKNKVKSIICLGINNSKIINVFKKFIPIILETKLMKNAVIISYNLSNPGDYILLSPACSSFDLFKNYKERGDQFKKEVKNLFDSIKRKK